MARLLLAAALATTQSSALRLVARRAAPLATASSARHGEVTVIPGLSAVADRYDAILLDQFGVLHNGAEALPGAVDCYDRLSAAGVQMAVLSNTSRRRAHALSKLPTLGFDAAKLADFVCSGEQAREHLASRAGQRMLWIGWDAQFQAWDPHYLDGLDLRLADAATADFVFLQGSQTLRDGSRATPTEVMRTGAPNDALADALRTCAARGLPMVCANPDLSVTLPDGSSGHMPGVVARAYEALGGSVLYYGKPHPAAFKAALASLGVPPSRVLHVGDSLLHDVAGARAAGVDSLFVAGGIHAEALGVVPDGGGGGGASPLREAALEALFDDFGVWPTMSAPAFVWQ